MQRSKPLFVEIGDGLSIMIGTPTLASWGNDTRPQAPKPGTFGFNTETNSLEYFDGNDWYAATMGE